MDGLVFRHQEILTVYWAILDQPAKIEKAILSHFCKVNLMLIRRRASDFARFLTCRGDLATILHHLDDEACPDLSDVLFATIQNDTASEGISIIDWFADHQLIDRLVDRMISSDNEMTRENAQRLLSDIIRLSQTNQFDASSIGFKQLLEQLTSYPVIKRIAHSMFDLSCDLPNALVPAISMIVDLIRNNQSVISVSEFATLLDSTLDIFTTHIPQLLSKLELSGKQTFIETPIGRQEPVGIERLAVCELFAALYYSSHTNEQFGHLFKQSLIDHAVLSRLLDMFFGFPWCNFLHVIVYDMLYQIFHADFNQPINYRLLMETLETNYLMKRILQAHQANEKFIKEQKARLGFMGHISLLSRCILEVFQSQVDVATKMMDTDCWDEWVLYVQTSLKKDIQRDNGPLGCKP
ncbi:SIT4 phosphatase-associated protein family [Radiomyces spectabilis]|uniref:SIT4 phosphatase-associated protein family n=1 Tax=Radiomyces spectabilis TaxID=64574 RepID=UPI00221F03A6|nr:SIT4 phosphatase-associated protein family [Radiomyces spectabilis]KAI8384999.1 SIT4 phosphatase-associated protein family [Radiomyces spectabilis]